MEDNKRRIVHGEPITSNLSGNSLSRDPLLKDQAYARLKELITTGEVPSGTFFSEKRLSSLLGMSKTPIRAALERLEAEGFVTTSARQGAVVRGLSLKEVVDLFDLRFALETFVVRHLALRLTEPQARRLRENLEAQLLCAETGDVNRYTQLDTDFHAAICECSGNQEIVRIMWHLRDKLYLVILNVMRQKPSRMETSTEEHSKVLDELVEGNGERAAAAMLRHLEYGKQFLISR
jgi:GntR family transcriptional regulator, rspAB operon transcriptional repressor